MCDQVLTKCDENDRIRYEIVQEHYFIRINKFSAKNITQGFGRGLPSKLCVSGMLVIQTGGKDPQPLT